MPKALLIARREALAYLTSPVSYVIALVFTLIAGYFFVDALSVPFPEASVSPYAGALTLVLLFIAPALTMRLFAEERRLGTLDLLMAAPVTDWQLVIGKYLAVLGQYVLLLTATLLFAAVLYWLGAPDTGVVATTYLGLLLYGGASLAVGLWASSLTANQALSAIVGMGVLLLLSVAHLAGARLSSLAGVILTESSMVEHFADLRRGVLDLTDVSYYLSVTAVFLFLCVRSVESRRWV